MSTLHRAGERIGPWTLEALLGQGGFSEVWRARRAQGGAWALKLLTHPEHVSQLRAEADALARVRGAGIVALVEVALQHDPPYLVMELVEGGSLRQREARHAGRDVVRALETIEALLAVLGRVHREGIVHGDLKPENVLFDRRERLLVADFGLSRRIAQRTATLSVSLSQEDARLAGTLDYMAPEQRAGQKPTPRSDVYACGVILYELLTGHRPQGVFQLPGAIDPSVPPAIDRLVACALAQEPAHRFATAGAMLAFLRAHPKEEWKVLARAHQRVSALLGPNGMLSALAETSTFVASLAIVVGAWGFVLVTSRDLRVTPGGVVSTASTAFAPGTIGALIGLGVTIAVYRALRPWLVRRRDQMVQLQRRLEEQIRTGQRWRQAQ